MDREEVGIRTEPHSVLRQELGKGRVVKMEIEHTSGYREVGYCLGTKDLRGNYVTGFTMWSQELADC